MNKIELLRTVLTHLASISEDFTDIITPAENIEKNIFINKEKYPTDKIIELLTNVMSKGDYDDLSIEEKKKLYRTQNDEIVNRADYDFYKCYINQAMQELHCRISNSMGVTPSKIVYTDFKYMPYLNSEDFVSTDIKANTTYINSNEVYIEDVPKYALLQMVCNASYQNRINKLISALVKGETVDISDEDMFLVLQHAIHRFNLFEIFEEGKMDEVKFMVSFESAQPLDISACYHSFKNTKKLLKIGNQLENNIKELKYDRDDYVNFLRKQFVVKAAKVSKIDLICAINNKNVNRFDKLRIIIYALYKELGKTYFKSMGMKIGDDQTIFEYLNILDKRFILNNYEDIESCIDREELLKIVEDRCNYLTPNEVETFENKLAKMSSEYEDDDEEEFDPYLENSDDEDGDFDEYDEDDLDDDNYDRMETEHILELMDIAKIIRYKSQPQSKNSFIRKISNFDLGLNDYLGEISEIFYDKMDPPKNELTDSNLFEL